MNGATVFVNNSADGHGGEDRHHAASGVDVYGIARTREDIYVDQYQHRLEQAAGSM